LREYELMDHLKLNLETNHATLAGHTMQHELEVAIAANALGSIDANTGDLLAWLGYGSVPNQHLSHDGNHASLYSKMGGFVTGGTNFDAKVRRESLRAG
jgi:xylose isomerase